jgi:hypothetical protein
MRFSEFDEEWDYKILKDALSNASGLSDHTEYYYVFISRRPFAFPTDQHCFITGM